MKQIHTAAFIDYFPYDEGIWVYDRELMKKSGRPEFKNVINSSMPTDKIGLVIEQTFHSIVEGKDGEIVEGENIVKCAENMVEKVESVWNKRLTEYNIEVVPAKTFFVELKTRDQEINSLLPSEKRGNHASVPAAVSRSFKKEILIPDEYVTRIIQPTQSMIIDPFDPKIQNMKSENKYSKWKKPILESVVTEELSHLIFRQERGESGEKEYIDFVKSCPIEALNWISQYNEVVAQYIGEKVLTTKEHAPIVLRDRLTNLWANAQRRSCYSAIKALSEYYPISKLALFDTILVPPGIRVNPHIIGFFMYTEHPTYQRRFEYVKDIWQSDMLP